MLIPVRMQSWYTPLERPVQRDTRLVRYDRVTVPNGRTRTFVLKGQYPVRCPEMRGAFGARPSCNFSYNILCWVPTRRHQEDR